MAAAETDYGLLTTMPTNNNTALDEAIARLPRTLKTETVDIDKLTTIERIYLLEIYNLAYPDDLSAKTQEKLEKLSNIVAKYPDRLKKATKETAYLKGVGMADIYTKALAKAQGLL